jgi:hypothetical protein
MDQPFDVLYRGNFFVCENCTNAVNRSRVLEKPTGLRQLVNKFAAFYGNWKVSSCNLVEFG